VGELRRVICPECGIISKPAHPIRERARVTSKGTIMICNCPECFTEWRIDTAGETIEVQIVLPFMEAKARQHAAKKGHIHPRLVNRRTQ